MKTKHIYLFRFTHGESNEDLIEGFIGDGKQITKIEELASMQNALREQGYENPKIKDYKLLRKEKNDKA